MSPSLKSLVYNSRALWHKWIEIRSLSDTAHLKENFIADFADSKKIIRWLLPLKKTQNF